MVLKNPKGLPIYINNKAYWNYTIFHAISAIAQTVQQKKNKKAIHAITRNIQNVALVYLHVGHFLGLSIYHPMVRIN